MPSPVDVAEAREAWRKYVSTGALTRAMLREPIFRAWERCHDFGTSPLQPQAESLSPDATERLLARKDDLLGASHSYMTALSRAAGDERHAAMLGDDRGVVLEIIGDHETVHGPEPFPGPGALLAEEVSGANGIGTPLAGAAYVELVGPEHFIGGFHVFTCQGVPFRAPDGSVAGVISTSVRTVEASARLREILVCAAHGIEAELLRARLEDGVRNVLSSSSGASLERLRQDVIQSYASARVQIEAATRKAAQRPLDATLAVLEEAQRAIERFRRQASLWRDLVTTEAGATGLVAVDQLTADVVQLLQTEARIRRVELATEALEPVVITYDPRVLARTVFASILAALDAAAAGGAVRVSLSRPTSAAGVLNVRSEPAGADGLPLDRTVSLFSRPK